MQIRIGRTLVLMVALGAIGWIGWSIREQLGESEQPRRVASERKPIPVEAVEIRHGPIELRRTFSGTLEASARFVVSPKVAARIERVAVDLADPVQRGALVLELDDDELQHDVTQSRSGLAVARANLAQTKSALETATRSLTRTETLIARGVASEVQLDADRAAETARRADVDVAAAQVQRAESALDAAKTRLGYARIHAEWTGGSDERVVAERFVDPGDTAAPGTALLDIVDLDDVKAIIYVAERDYNRLENGQIVTLTTDAFPGETFEGQIARIAPIFRQTTRQARVEVLIPNAERRLKPGMFIRATVVLARVEDATIIPEAALSKRGDHDGVFVIDATSSTVIWIEVETGIVEDGWVQVRGAELTGRVVTLGQQLLEDGAAVSVPDDETRTPQSAE